jgi:hypothetical protein
MKERRTKRLKELRLSTRLAYGRREKGTSTKWWSDPPKLAPILISLIAIAISCLSWWESRRSRLMNEEINRPLLVLSKMDHHSFSSSGIGFGNISTSFVAVIKNTGKVTALIEDVHVRPSRVRSMGPDCQIVYGVTTNLPDVVTQREILPGMEAEYLGVIHVRLVCSAVDLQYIVNTTLTYTDINSGKSYKQSFTQIVRVSPFEN